MKNLDENAKKHLGIKKLLALIAVITAIAAIICFAAPTLRKSNAISTTGENILSSMRPAALAVSYYSAQDIAALSEKPVIDANYKNIAGLLAQFSDLQGYESVYIISRGADKNYKYIIDTFKSPYYDKENRYSVPYTYGMLGIIYNRTVVDEGDLGSWELLWNEKYDGDILQFNNPRDAFATAMYSLSLDVNSTNPEDWRVALEKLKEQKALLQGYVNDEIFNKMTTESAAIAPYFVGDFLTMVSQEENLDFFYPKEGVNYIVDAMCIPKASKNPEIAKEYINFMLSEEIAVANAEYMGYASPNSLVVNNADYREYMNTEYLAPTFDDEGNMLTLGAYELLYNKGPEEVNAAYDALFKDKQSPACYRNFTPEIQALLNDHWEELKIYDSTETWIHVTSASIVAVVLGFAAYSIYIKKKRSRHYRKKSKKES